MATRTKGVSSSKKEADSIREASLKKKTKIDKDVFAPSGSTLLNLACTDTPFNAYKLGGLVSIPGQSQAGKTLLGLNCFAECNALRRFDDYTFVHDLAEQRMDFDISYLFTEELKARLEAPPFGHGGTIQQFEANQLSLIKSGKPFIYVLDSFDALTSDEELEKEFRKAMAMAKSEEAAKKIAGSYGTEKAKIAGQILRMVKDNLKETNSLLIILQQRRQKMNAMPFTDPWTTAGGEAPFFYSNHQIWLTITGHEKDPKTRREIGTKTLAKIKKNSITGKFGREAEFTIYNDYGIDNIGSCVDFMTTEGFWKKDGHGVVAEGILDSGEKLRRKELIALIEKENLETELARIVGRAWNEIEEELRLSFRKPRYK